MKRSPSVDTLFILVQQGWGHNCGTLLTGGIPEWHSPKLLVGLRIWHNKRLEIWCTLWDRSRKDREFLEFDCPPCPVLNANYPEFSVSTVSTMDKFIPNDIKNSFQRTKVRSTSEVKSSPLTSTELWPLKISKCGFCCQSIPFPIGRSRPPLTTLTRGTLTALMF